MAIFKPEVVSKRITTRSGEFEDGAEVYLLSDHDSDHNNDKDYFKIKLGYNGIHHYFPIIPKGVMQFMDSFNSVQFYSANLKQVMKALADQSPRETNFQNIVRIGYDCLNATTSVFSGLNPLTGATGTTRTTTPADFGFPVAPSSQPSSSSGKSSTSGRKRMRTEASEKDQPEYQPEEQEQAEEEEDELVFQSGTDNDDSPQITIKHNVQLKKLSTQCFCGKAGFKTPREVEKHRLAVHTGHGRGVNPKTKKPRDYWKCSQCNEEASDPRACWKHFRTTHLKNFIHYCPVPGCDYGNDQKDSIVSHIIRNHKNEDEWIQKAHQQNWLRCKSCLKFFTSIKGKNKHEMTCGTPKIKLNCIFENCHKTYTTQEAMDQHVEVAHHGKGHKTLCPQCGQQFSSQQSLNRHMENKHK